MKLDEVAQLWKVIRAVDKSKVFTGSKDACINFIRAFDATSDSYVDLRLLDNNDKEFDYHNTGK